MLTLFAYIMWNLCCGYKEIKKMSVVVVGQSSLYLKDLILLCTQQQIEFKEIKKRREFV